MTLPEDLAGIQAALARRFREALEGEDPVTPAFLDQARRFLSDSLAHRPPPVPAPPLVADLPFPDEVE